MSENHVGNRVAALDGLRAIAIALVIAGHAGEAYGLREHPWWLAPAINPSFGVRLFFVLSGFLITLLLMREQETRGAISLKAFYMRRVLRIFPAFYLFLGTIGLFAACGIIEISWQQFAAAASYTWNYLAVWYGSGPAEGSWFLGHLWTLSLEEQFYLFWPLLIILAGFRRAGYVAVILPLALPLVRVVSYYLFPNLRGQLGMMFHTAIDSILIGCAFALYRQSLPAWVMRREVFWGCLIYPFVLSPIIGLLCRPYYVTVGFGLDAICAAILILHASRPGAFSRLLSWEPMRLVGTWSYSLYLWQQLFLTSYNTTWTGRFPLSVLSALICALASYYLIEKPVLRWKRKFERVSPLRSSAAATPVSL